MTYMDLSRKNRPDGRIDKLINDQQTYYKHHLDLSEKWLKYADTVDARIRHWEQKYSQLEQILNDVEGIVKTPVPPPQIIQPIHQTIYEPCTCKCVTIPDTINEIPTIIKRLDAVENAPAVEEVVLVGPESRPPAWPLYLIGAWLLFLTYVEVFDVFRI